MEMVNASLLPYVIVDNHKAVPGGEGAGLGLSISQLDNYPGPASPVARADEVIE